MIEKIYELSKIFCENEDIHEKLSEISTREIGYFIEIDLDKESYEGLSPFKPSALGKKLLFVGKRGNVSKGFSPSINLQESDDEKLRKILEKLVDFFNHEKTKRIHKILEKFKEKICENLKEISPKERKRALLSVRVKEGGKKFLPSERDDIKEVFKEKQLSHEKEKHDICFLCGRKKSSYPQLNEVFKFVTFDKPGFTPVISKKSYGVISICDECRADLKSARTFIEENLSFAFFDNDVLWIIPYSPEPRYLKKIIDELKNIYSEKQLRKFSEIEKTIEERLSEVGEESISYDFIVLSISSSTNEEKIILHITDVSPSRLSKIVTETNRIYEEFKKIYDSSSESPNTILKNLYEIFKPPKPKGIGKKQKSKGMGKKQFYELIKSIYENKPFSRNVFLFYSMRWARNKIISSDSNKLIQEIVKTGKTLFSLYIYLKRINVFKGGRSMETEEFFKKYPEFFDEEWKKAVFLTGALTGYLIEYQIIERRKYQSNESGNAPFVKKLKGLKMRKEDVKGLLPEIKAKTLQYKIENYKLNKLFSDASEHYLKTGSWQASVDEINFVFTVGMSMYTKLFRRDENEKE